MKPQTIQCLTNQLEKTERSQSSDYKCSQDKFLPFLPAEPMVTVPWDEAWVLTSRLPDPSDTESGASSNASRRKTKEIQIIISEPQVARLGCCRSSVLCCHYCAIVEQCWTLTLCISLVIFRIKDNFFINSNQDFNYSIIYQIFFQEEISHQKNV